VDEMPPGRCDRQLLTSLCGGAAIAARELHCRQEEFMPTHTMFANGNQLPGMDNDPAILRRVYGLPFDAMFRVKNDPDPDLRLDENNKRHFLRNNDLDVSPEAFLTWVVQGAVKYLQEGKLPPKPTCCAVKANEIKEDNDKLQEFIEEQCVVGLHLREPVATFLIEYRKWRGFLGIRKKEVHGEMEKKGFKRARCRDENSFDRNKDCYYGLVLASHHNPLRQP
jgi:phage/plasmid-associated DNA primase